MTISALTIAGSDPSGGAGIQADLRVFNALGVAGLSAITALTVQNSLGVLDVHPVQADVLFDQIEAILEDSPVRAVKIGMLGGAEQVRAVAEALRRFRPPNVVLDPVLASTGGVPLLDEAGVHALLTDLLPLCDLVTPNLGEASVLTGSRAPGGWIGTGTAEALAIRLRRLGARAVLVTGGHLTEQPDDVFVDSSDCVHIFRSRRVDTPHTHGTGCTLSSIVAAYMAIDDSLEDMIGEAKSLLTLALRHPLVAGSGRGYPNVLSAVRANGEPYYRTPSERLRLLRGVYVLTDEVLRPDRDHEDMVTEAMMAGATVVQLRTKSMPTPDHIATAQRIRRKTWNADMLFLINDRIDIALAADADGVHLGPDDMHPADARRLLGPEKLIGVSVSTVAEAEPIAQYASYLGVGAIFGSLTKSDAGPPVGLDRIREIKRAFPNHPIVAIGGINGDNIASVAEAGADAAAVVSAVVCAPDMKAATEELARRFEEGRRRRET